MDNRLKEINLRLSEYSIGNFDNNIKISPKLDEVDAISSGINMLGEELKSITISRDYFNNIFNSVSDMVFILNPRGIITDANKSAKEQLRYDHDSLIGKKINELINDPPSFFTNMVGQLKKNGPYTKSESMIYSRKKEAIPVKIGVSYLTNEKKDNPILLTASDITFQINTENLIIRAIIDTQEKERQRLAKDFHDSLIQQLSAIKFYISSTSYLSRSQKLKTILNNSNEALSEVINEMRNTCFNLMPKTLHEFGLVKAVREFCNHSIYHRKTNFIIEQSNKLPEFSSEIKIDLYRVIQEFINNAINHGEASEIKISFYFNKKILKVKLLDNGKGFESKQIGKGMGLQNVKSRVKSHNGTLDIISNIGKGTCYKIGIPLNL
ncbi:MAG: PAS domain S-box protein [Bacteroidota bacterium]|nr:PAS domain S-box protein [Bacteroidota bacterium]